MNTLHQNVLEAIAAIEKVADKLHPSCGKVVKRTAKFTANYLIEGNTYEVINHSGHYYWLVCGGRWIDKDLFETVKL